MVNERARDCGRGGDDAYIDGRPMLELLMVLLAIGVTLAVGDVL